MNQVSERRNVVLLEGTKLRIFPCRGGGGGGYSMSHIMYESHLCPSVNCPIEPIVFSVIH